MASPACLGGAVDLVAIRRRDADGDFARETAAAESDHHEKREERQDAERDPSLPAVNFREIRPHFSPTSPSKQGRTYHLSRPEWQ